ncbi:hypothetical protein THRCLA_06313 [Thraustotheca clavata]|uniref:FYVE-type domain-containing protein n=1 Tax=Thraustotheca clavata TaxID=74557 RepID=A0A1V9ZPY0_9STRA|nr:hypothetical protein THRCLA_06313 [Thraustotheca clavata]
MSLPLNKQIQLSHEDEVAFASRAQQLLKHALNTTPVMPPSTESLGFKVYKYILKNEYFCIGSMQGSLDDIKYAFYADTTPDTKNVAAITLGKYYHDAGVIQVLQQKTQHDSFRFMGVKYIQPAKSSPITKSKDPVVHLECCGTHVDKETGQSVLYQILEWIDMELYSTPQYSLEKPIKATCSMINLFRAESPTSIGLFSATLYDTGYPIFLSRLNTGSSYCDFLARLSSLPVSRRLLDASPIAQPCVINGKICSVCQSQLKALRAKHDCLACGDVMCSNCTHYVQSPLTTNKYCTKCVAKARQYSGCSSPLTEQETSPLPFDESPAHIPDSTNQEDLPDNIEYPMAQIQRQLSEQNIILSNMRFALERRAQCKQY